MGYEDKLIERIDLRKAAGKKTAAPRCEKSASGDRSDSECSIAGLSQHSDANRKTKITQTAQKGLKVWSGRLQVLPLRGKLLYQPVVCCSKETNGGMMASMATVNQNLEAQVAEWDKKIEALNNQIEESEAALHLIGVKLRVGKPTDELLQERMRIQATLEAARLNLADAQAASEAVRLQLRTKREAEAAAAPLREVEALVGRGEAVLQSVKAKLATITEVEELATVVNQLRQHAVMNLGTGPAMPPHKSLALSSARGLQTGLFQMLKPLLNITER